MENNNNIQENNAAAVQPAQYEYKPEESGVSISEDPVMMRRKIRQSYGWAGLSMILQFIIVMAVSVIAAVIYSTIRMTSFMAATPDMTQEQLVEFTNEFTQSVSSNGRYIMTVNAVSYLIANLSAVAIGISALRAFKVKSLFGKSRLGAGHIALGVLSALGIQAVSMFVQNIVMSITGISGIDPETSSMMGMSGDTLLNVIILVYFVIIAPVTEEILCRGLVMNALAPVSRRFALIASALLFGLMHGNLNQIFNGILLGLVLGYMALKSGSVIPSIIAHMALNANAMFCSYVYEYKLLEASGMETASIAEMAHFAVLLVVGIIALAVLLKKNGKIRPDDMVVPEYSCEVSPTDEKKLTWGTLAKCPSVWIVAAIYIIMALTSMTLVGA